MTAIFQTASVCPVCKQRIPAEYVQEGAEVLLIKNCPEHGTFKTAVWKGGGFLKWCGDWVPKTDDHPACPQDCGLCERHLNRTCCTILDLTERCDLRCNFCFADSGSGKDLSFQDAVNAMDDIFQNGSGYLHLSGGEPALHPEILELIRYAKEKGFVYLQLNTNGRRIAEDPGFSHALRQAGVSSVFLSFDGLNDEIYKQICGRPLLDVKLKAIKNCDAACLGVVLVPRIIKGINDNDIGSIVRFAYENMPAVKGVHFQPVTYTGRYIKGEHMLLPEILDGIEQQTEGLIKREDFLPSSCDAPLCGFHAEYRKDESGLVLLKAIPSCSCGTKEGKPERSCCDPPKGKGETACCASEPKIITLQRKRKVSKSQLHVKNRWTRTEPGNYETGSLAAKAKELNEQSFFISGMLFQDLETLDLARCRCCSLHVYRDGNFLPFCVRHNLQDMKY